MTATTLAPAFHVTHRTAAGSTITPITAVPDDTWVTAIATITTVRARGTGGSLRVHLGLTADNDTIAVATLDADRIQQIPDFMRRPNLRVEVRGILRRLPKTPPVIEVCGIELPAAA